MITIDPAARATLTNTINNATTLEQTTRPPYTYHRVNEPLPKCSDKNLSDNDPSPNTFVDFMNFDQDSMAVPFSQIVH